MTIGIPFCIYKILFGILSLRMGILINDNLLIVSGYIIITWATADFFMNTTRALFDLFRKDSFVEYCILAQAGRIYGASPVFLAVDTLITFSIICFILWSGWITHLTPGESIFWNFATTLNLISLSLVGLWNEILRFKGNIEP